MNATANAIFFTKSPISQRPDKRKAIRNRARLPAGRHAPWQRSADIESCITTAINLPVQTQNLLKIHDYQRLMRVSVRFDWTFPGESHRT